MKFLNYKIAPGYTIKEVKEELTDVYSTYRTKETQIRDVNDEKLLLSILSNSDLKSLCDEKFILEVSGDSNNGDIY